jgi:hypothetical protein
MRSGDFCPPERSKTWRKSITGRTLSCGVPYPVPMSENRSEKMRPGDVVLIYNHGPNSFRLGDRYEGDESGAGPIFLEARRGWQQLKLMNRAGPTRNSHP